ncbi:hypothetical protein HMH01_00245 [Halovulum dunhuangense]|uniref:Uncharacterized protein n=1 Tax=Halovulum dunhuangense TaxID=1505036 RepID=A0A849KP94_9RHOB|nr:hypothetical protein [Halovulum dunhuangense]NNU78853.1 hypothetical protein [Halovulum dunhuangense]
MAEGFWAWGPMPTLQRWVDASRDWVDPLIGLTVLLALAILVLALASRPPSTRDHLPPGSHYTGKVDFSKVKSLVNPRRGRRPKNRREMEAAIRRASAARRKREREGRDG